MVVDGAVANGAHARIDEANGKRLGLRAGKGDNGRRCFGLALGKNRFWAGFENLKCSKIPNIDLSQELYFRRIWAGFLTTVNSWNPRQFWQWG